MRTNSSGVTEVASIRGDMDKFADGWDRIFGKKESMGDSSHGDNSSETENSQSQSEKLFSQLESMAELKVSRV